MTWRSTRLGDILPFKYGKGLPERERSESGEFAVVSSAGRVGSHHEALTRESSVVIGRKGTIGATYYCPHPVWPIDTTFFVEGSEDVDIRFGYYLLRSLPLSQMNNDSAVPGLNRTQAEALVVKIPDLPEQRAIAATLGALDDKIESNRRAVELVHTLMRSHYDAAPKRSVVASDVITPVLGGTPKRNVPDYWDGNIKWASAKDVVSAQGGFVVTTAETISDAGVKSSAAKVMPAGTIVMTARGTVGAVTRLGEPMAFNQSCYGLRVNEGGEASLLVALEAAVAHIKNAGHGTVFNTVNMATFDQIELEVPFSHDLDETLAALSDVVLQRLKENGRIAALRDTLLPELLSGRIRVPAEGGAA